MPTPVESVAAAIAALGRPTTARKAESPIIGRRVGDRLEYFEPDHHDVR